MSASQQQRLSGRGASVYTAHRGWLGVVTGIISAASTGGVLVMDDDSDGDDNRVTPPERNVLVFTSAVWRTRYQKKHPPTILIIIQSLSASSVYHDP